MKLTRTFEWQKPVMSKEPLATQSGLEFLRKVAGRERMQVAPVAQCLNFQLVEVDDGLAVFELTPAEYHENPFGTVHGGVLATLCDSAAGASVHSTLTPGEAYTSLEIKVSFLRAVTTKTGTLRCEGRVLARGARVATAEARLTDETGRLYAHATSTCLVFTMDR